MFVRYYLELPFGSESVREALLRTPEAWIPGLAFDAEERGEAMVGQLEFGPIHKRVAIEMGEPMLFPGRTVLPMVWRSAAGQALFPVFEAEIEVAGLGPERTHVSISARYRPPLGALGRAIDSIVLHRVAETTIKDFLDQVGAKLDSLTRES